MPIIKLELWDKNQAEDLRRFLQQRLSGARLVTGTHDSIGRSVATDRHLSIDYHDQQLIEHQLYEYFYPKGHDWREFRRD